MCFLLQTYKMKYEGKFLIGSLFYTHTCNRAVEADQTQYSNKEMPTRAYVWQITASHKHSSK